MSIALALIHSTQVQLKQAIHNKCAPVIKYHNTNITIWLWYNPVSHMVNNCDTNQFWTEDLFSAINGLQKKKKEVITKGTKMNILAIKASLDFTEEVNNNSFFSKPYR